MTRITCRRARRIHRCSCGARIVPGDRYLEHVASPNHGDYCGPHWSRLAECAACATRYGRADALVPAVAAGEQAPREGSQSLVVWWKVCRRNGGWNAVGLDARDEIAYECLHLHAARADGLTCGRQHLAHAEGPSQ